MYRPGAAWLLIAVGVVSTSCQRTQESTRSTERLGGDRLDTTASVAIPSPSPKPDPLVLVEEPARGAVIASPVRVSGRARGTWYFEADFPVYLYDSRDKMIGTGIARAQGDWMTTEYVPFEVTFPFNPPPGDSTGTLVLEKSNPSGLPQNAASVRLPVRFR